jgi:regulator of protease activity HflC (stomatin/prohibitin superfamily)
MRKVNITEKMADIEPQEVITKDNLNAKVDLVVYYKVRPTEVDIKKALYAVNNFEYQIVTLARTTARNVIGGMVFKDVNSKRKELNTRLAEVLAKETSNWGVEVVRVELMEILPPNDVQETMNKVIKAENEKDAAIDFATARETEADGIKRANIKEAEGIAQGRLIVADAKAKAIKLVNESARKYFKGNAQSLKQLEVAETALKDNSKIVLGNDSKSVLKLFDIGKQ